MGYKCSSSSAARIPRRGAHGDIQPTGANRSAEAAADALKALREVPREREAALSIFGSADESQEERERKRERDWQVSAAAAHTRINIISVEHPLCSCTRPECALPGLPSTADREL